MCSAKLVTQASDNAFMYERFRKCTRYTLFGSAPKKSAADAADPVETPRTAAQLKSLEDTPGSIWDEESEDDETTEESEEEAQQEDQEEDGENEDEREEEQDDYEVCSACLLASHFRSH